MNSRFAFAFAFAIASTRYLRAWLFLKAFNNFFCFDGKFFFIFNERDFAEGFDDEYWWGFYDVFDDDDDDVWPWFLSRFCDNYEDDVGNFWLGITTI